MPAKEVMSDQLSEADVEEDEKAECIDTFILNAKFLGLLRTIAGSGQQRSAHLGSTLLGEAAQQSAKAIPLAQRDVIEVHGARRRHAIFFRKDTSVLDPRMVRVTEATLSGSQRSRSDGR
jgi:hypothetical protein